MSGLKDTLAAQVRRETPGSMPPFASVLRRARQRRHRRRVVVVAAVGAAALAVPAAALTVPGLLGPDPGRAPVAGSSPGAEPGPGRSGEVEFGAMMSCVEQYEPAAVADRAFAFDGTVVDLSEPQESGSEADLPLLEVTFQVHTWYAGGDGPEVTVSMYEPAVTSAQTLASYGVGTRLLVSGEPRWGGAPLADPIAFSCGFTRYYDPQTAAEWAAATG